MIRICFLPPHIIALRLLLLTILLLCPTNTLGPWQNSVVIIHFIPFDQFLLSIFNLETHLKLLIIFLNIDPTEK